MIVTNYAIYDPSTHRTDIDIVPPDAMNMFGRAVQSTEFLSAVSKVDWLRRASERFELVLSSDRNLSAFVYFSQADALTSPLRLSELAYATVTATVRNAIDHEEEYAGPNITALTKQLTTWLGATYDQLADMTGVSRAAFFYWRRPGATPRADNVRQVERLYAVVSLLIKRFGVQGARSWLYSGEPPRWDQLLAGNLTAVEGAARSQLFHQNAITSSNELPLDEVYLDLPSQPHEQRPGLRRAKRKPTRGRLSTE
jgi:hypothetical protein